MFLLLDIGNTRTHAALGNLRKIGRAIHFPTVQWNNGFGSYKINRLVKGKSISIAAFCSVVPAVNNMVEHYLQSLCSNPVFQLNYANCGDLQICYPKPATIGTDRLASALAASQHFGWPILSINFGTAATFDVVDEKRCFIGGAIAPGIAIMNEYLKKRTAQLPFIPLQKTKSYVGKSTRQAILAGAVLGYRGLVEGLISGIKKETGYNKMPVVATGGYASLIARITPTITKVLPSMALEGLRLALLRTVQPIHPS